MPTEQAGTKKNCHCHHCHTNGFTRGQLNRWFLCPACAVTPGVQGYAKASERGLASGSPAYWNATLGQLNIVTDDEMPCAALTGDGQPTPIAGSTPETKPLTEVQKWKAGVFAAPLAAEVKVCLLKLVEYGDYETGANIRPKEATVAEALGCTRWQVRRLLRLGRAWALPYRMKRRAGSGWDTVNLYQLRRPAEAKYGAWEGPVVCTQEWLSVKGTCVVSS